MRLLYNLKKQTLDSHMSDSNVGGRQNHIWVINAIIHDQVSSVNKKTVFFQQFDYCQMFDSMDNGEACGDIFSYGINDDHLQLIHEANKKVVINVKTPHGTSTDYALTECHYILYLYLSE